MQFSSHLLLLGLSAGTAYCGILQVIDYNGECVMWSNDNHGCTGYSASFGQLKGNDCSQLSEMVNGTRELLSTLKVDTCGTEHGTHAAWIQVNGNSSVNFFNQNGDQSSCTLNNRLKVGSWCSTADS